MNYFEFGDTVDISQLDEGAAIALFGRPIYEAWRQTIGASAPGDKTPTAIRIKSVDRQKRTITVEVAE